SNYKSNCESNCKSNYESNSESNFESKEREILVIDLDNLVSYSPFDDYKVINTQL
ncbi:19597_t:CDS:1, partial [Racocetra persica]